jgi:flagellar P-ring protein FlgI
MQTREAIVKLLRKHVPTTTIDNLVMGSAALVALTCERPESATVGQYVDVQCKALGSSTSLRGGQLMLSELCGADGLAYVEVAGPVSLSGFPEEPAAAAIPTPKSATTGWLPKGGVVIRP